MDGTVEDGTTGWRVAAERALYGPSGFFVREAPAAHFRTSVHASPLFASAVARLLERLDERLGRPGRLDLVDVGAGRGELLTGVLAAVGPDVAARLRPLAVERAARPDGLDPRIDWTAALPGAGAVTGLLFANEWLDDVPLDVAETDEHGTARHVLVDARGREHLGGPVTGEDAAWLARWWPLDGAGPGTRAEIGRPRDAAWARAAAAVHRGAAIAVDYAHTAAARPPLGTLTGYRDGRQVPPVPDGSCDLTAHVALDACAAPGTPGTPGDVLLTQRAALHALGVRGTRPPLALASQDPAAYLRGLAAAGEAAELTDPTGLGGFTWLVRTAGTPPLLEPAPDGTARLVP